MKRKKFAYLSLEERHIVEHMHSRGASVAEIAGEIGCSAGVIYRELHRGDTGELDKYQRNGYSAVLGQRAFQQALKHRGRAPGAAAANTANE